MKRIALVVALASLSASAFADTVGSYLLSSDKSKQTMTISYKNDQAIRMDVGQGSYMLVNGSKVYMVTNHNGEVTVMDMDSMPKFAMPPPVKQTANGNAKVTKTGRTETIAGVKGDVYEILVDGKKHEAVVSSDKRVQGLQKAFTALAKKMGQAMGADTSAQIELAMREAQKYGNGGLLRSDQAMVLQSVGEKSLPASHYQLPAGAAPMQMPAMPAMDPAMMKQMQEAMQKMQQQQQQR